MLQVVVIIFYIDAFSTLQMLLQRFLLILYHCVTALYLNSYYAAILLLLKVICICFVASHTLLLLIKYFINKVSLHQNVCDSNELGRMSEWVSY